MILFSIQFFLTNIIFSVIICSVFVRLNKNEIHSNLELLLYSLGLGPVFTSLLLYYLLLFFPHHSSLFYLLTILFVYATLVFLGRKGFIVLGNRLKKKIQSIYINFKSLKWPQKTESILFYSIVFILISIFIFLYISNTLQTPLDATDALKYGVFGKIFFTEKSLDYRWIRRIPKSGYYWKMNHAPSFALLLTWDKLTGSFLNISSDIYYKSMSTYFALLIIAVLVLWLSRKSKYLALLGVFALISGFYFYYGLVETHLDSYRIFFFTLAWIFLAYAIEKKDTLSFLLLGIFSGFAAFAHSIGAVLVIFNCLALLLFLKGSIGYKLKKTVFTVFLVIAFGWFHYIVDMIWGYGWYLFPRNITWWG